MEVRPETASGDIKTLRVRLPEEDRFSFRPGQCAMLSVFGVGECMISISSPPTRPEELEFSVKRVGRVTAALHELEPGECIGIRGPYGNGFPVEELRGKGLLVVAGGIGLAPLRSLVNYVVDRREEYGPMRIVYGARTPQDLCFKEEIFRSWPGVPQVEVHLTVDQGDEEWTGPVGLVPSFLEELAPSPEGVVALTCGPPIMIKFVLEALQNLGFDDHQVLTTLELKMQCGIGKCGRCNIGSRYVCVDGPVFSLKELRQMPAEY